MSTPVVPVRTTQDLNGFFTQIFPQPVIASVAPTAGDNEYLIGQLWINSTANTAYILTSISPVGAANWLAI